MDSVLYKAFDDEMRAASRLRAIGDLDGAFAHLERAHILGQRYTLPHVRAHVAMLVIGWRRRDAREIFGQLARILAAGLFSRIWVPDGNTGGANVSALRRMPIPEDLMARLRAKSGEQK